VATLVHATHGCLDARRLQRGENLRGMLQRRCGKRQGVTLPCVAAMAARVMRQWMVGNAARPGERGPHAPPTTPSCVKTWSPSPVIQMEALRRMALQVSALWDPRNGIGAIILAGMKYRNVTNMVMAESWMVPLNVLTMGSPIIHAVN